MVVKLKGLCPDGKVPKGLLQEGKEALENEFIDRSKVFQSAKKQDSVNEGMPRLQSYGSHGPTGNSLTASYGSH